VVHRQRSLAEAVTLAVSDLDRTVEQLKSRGLVGAPIEVVGVAGRKARFSDADGNVVNFVEVAG
jgi:predicted enzyme related to lactoylglutathione lyase